MLEVEEAQSRILSGLETLGLESLPLSGCAGRILQTTLSSPLALPHADVSAMDGYAVVAAGTSGASSDAPARFRCIGSVPAGHQRSFQARAGECVRVFTGSWLPQGTDAVVMQEDTHVAGDCVEVREPTRPFENVRIRGEDVAQGTVVANAGDAVSAGHMALLGAVGFAAVTVSRRPTIGLLATGDELMEPGQPLGAGQIYESNRAALAALLGTCGARVRVFPFVRDTLSATRAALDQAFSECDAVVTTGGVSVGEHDFVKGAFEQMGGRLDFWKVSMKPGKPFVFGRLGGKSLFGLPGNPVSAFVTFLLLVRPAILRMQGASNLDLPEHPGWLAEAIQNRAGRRHFMRVAIDGKGNVRSAGLQASHALGSLASANGLLSIPPETSWSAGTAVSVLRWAI